MVCKYSSFCAYKCVRLLRDNLSSENLRCARDDLGCKPQSNNFIPGSRFLTGNQPQTGTPRISEEHTLEFHQ
jgi:hypothetical protein